MAKNLILWVVIALVLMSVFNSFGTQPQELPQVEYSSFITDVKQGRVHKVIIEGRDIRGVLQTGELFRTYVPEAEGSALIGELLANGVAIDARPPEQQSLLMQIFVSSFPILLLIGAWVFFMRQMQGGPGGRGALSFGKSRARLLGEDQVNVNFNDVAGVDEAKEEVSELVDFLKEPEKFQNLGGKIPRGVLMMGAPGTGKTLLARAIAGEAKVPFFTISGSDFVEMFVGVGASRVRDMFEQAKKHSPCIIFIDEIDAVGRHRGAGLGGGHDEREQTLNQLLVEMDGFEGNEGVIVIAATNRPDVLDPALLRPGRFDRQVVVSLPDIRGREQILKVHIRKVPANEDKVKPSIIARGTPGFSGADLANLVNEAALFAARADKNDVEMEDFEKAKDKIMMGTERRSMVMSEEEKKLTAYHEAGHAIVGRLVPSHDPVYKVTIIPRGRALGVTMFLPENDRYSHTKEYLESRISSTFGGRIAEELIFGADKITNGAAQDIEQATGISRNMVTKWGMSEKLGPLAYSEDEGEVFLGHSVTQRKNVSDDTANAIDVEIRTLIDRNYLRAERLLKENMDKLHLMAEALRQYETIDTHQIDDIMEGRIPRPPENWEEDQDAGKGAEDGGQDDQEKEPETKATQEEPKKPVRRKRKPKQTKVAEPDPA
uniref:ATP-dependent zinc metalloprotease FtsH n=1 Tax=Candidatus Kentrum sp. FM TaxID=2126340 RepID=A0A450TIZ9_9GAMM|nr:MAG: cell division protease FtsH [Candidatus Kentron sp. FM]VFJ67316.1 MAG: cell division protease FtsH [Candidatus Kentron sp. FM]VFK16623.1 MAG: cell division protease FtsH [Candidatus Kentron sp. FM]